MEQEEVAEMNRTQGEEGREGREGVASYPGLQRGGKVWYKPFMHVH